MTAMVANGCGWFDAGKAAALIERTERQREALEKAATTPPARRESADQGDIRLALR
jgi:hypothetical protein